MLPPFTIRRALLNFSFAVCLHRRFSFLPASRRISIEAQEAGGKFEFSTALWSENCFRSERKASAVFSVDRQLSAVGFEGRRRKKQIEVFTYKVNSL
jgi:hypothetical protein